MDSEHTDTTETCPITDIGKYKPYLTVLAVALFQKTGIQRSYSNKIEIEDIVQETLLKAWEKRRTFSGRTDRELRVWLRTTLANLITDKIRGLGTEKRDVRKEIQLNLDRSSQNLEELLIDRQTATPSTLACRREETNRLCEAILRLRPTTQAVILARHIEGKTFREIGTSIGKTREAVTKIWARGLVELQFFLGKEGKNA